MKQRFKVLVSAYACNPYKGSEPGVGWGFVSALAVQHELHVIVEEEKCRLDIERWLKENPGHGLSVKFYFLRKKRNRLLRKIWPPSYYTFYRRWHRDALHLGRQLHANESFDVTHQLTMVGFREPGYLWTLPVPFVWGPIGGMGYFPWRFLLTVGLRGGIYYLAYNIYNFLQTRFLPRPRRAARIAHEGLIAATTENQQGALEHWGVHPHLLTEVGLPCIPARDFSRREEGEALRLVWSGLHIKRKALNIALEALGTLPLSCDWTLDVLGEGEESESWKLQARALGIGPRVKFHGWLPRDEALGIMKSAHLMLITSLRDLTSTVTVEALSYGLPIVCPDGSGFADVVNDGCGIRVPLTRPRETVAAFGRVIAALYDDEYRRRSLAEGALRRAAHFDWLEKASVVDRIYHRAIDAWHERTR